MSPQRAQLLNITSKRKPCEQHGFTLLLTLIMLALVSALIIAYFSLAGSETISSQNLYELQRAKLAARSALNEVVSKLKVLCADDDYIVEAITHTQNKKNSRYTFVTRWNEEKQSFDRVPLFSGGKTQSLSAEAMRDLDAPDRKAKWELRGENSDQARHILYNLWMQPGKKIESQPVVAWQVPEVDDASFMFAYWVEDMEAVPNLDALRSEIKNEEEQGRARFGYQSAKVIAEGENAELDKRVGKNYEADITQDSFEKFPAYLKPYSKDGKFFQILQNQPVPGINPAEMFYPLPRSDGEKLENPADFQRQSSLIATTSSALLLRNGVENRYSVGLMPYGRKPIIPHSFGYIDEGKAKKNINKFVASGNASELATFIESNIIDFNARAGDFPENYGKTIAANIIDYADFDSLPTHQDKIYRGYDNYPLENERFLRWHCEKIEKQAENWLITLSLTPYIELWNMSNKTSEPLEVSVAYNFADDYALEVDGEKQILRELAPKSQPDKSPQIVLLPNEYRVIGGDSALNPTETFGKYLWEIILPAKEDSAEKPLSIRLIPPPEINVSRLRSQLLVKDTRHTKTYAVSTTGQDGGYPGMILPAWGNIEEGASVVFAYAPALAHGTVDAQGNFGGQITTHMGDARMAYYSNSPQIFLNYPVDATPFGANSSFSVNAGERWTRSNPAFWPDGGYTQVIGNHPSSSDQDPDKVAPPEYLPAYAPARISNQGRYFSLAELGYVFDPIMWRTEESLAPIDANSDKDGAWGGGNTLRIGREEHPRFKSHVYRASSLLDLFHCGGGGSSAFFSQEASDEFDPVTGEIAAFAVKDPQPYLEEDAYSEYNSKYHLPPPTAPDASSARERPYTDIYEHKFHALSPLRRIYGHININSAPTLEELKMLVEGLYAADNILGFYENDKQSGASVENMTPVFRQATTEEIPLRRIDSDLIAKTLMKKRPFFAWSQVADALAEVPDKSLLAQTPFVSDAIAEEPLARVLGCGQLASRHFRVHVAGVALNTRGRKSAQIFKVFEIFMRPIHDKDGDIVDIVPEILYERTR